MKLPLLAKFRIYPDKSRWYYFQVFIWKRRSEMRAAIRKAGVNAPHCEAICCCNRVYRVNRHSSRATGILGQIHFHRLSFTMGIITHECTHAALAWAREAKLDVMADHKPGHDASPTEERFCWVLGNLARQVVLQTNRQWKYPAGRDTEGCSYV